MQQQQQSRVDDGQANRPPVLPDEIVVREILTRLPTKSFLRFRSVSKEWRSLISDPIFVQSQNKHVVSSSSSDSDPHHHRKLMLLSPSLSQFYSLDQENLAIGAVQKAHQFRIPVSAPHGVSVIGSCNGLLCIGIVDHKALDSYSHYYVTRESIPCPDHRENDNIVRTGYLRMYEGSSVGHDAIIWNPLFKSYHKVTGFLYTDQQGPSDQLLVGFGCSTDDNYKLIKVFEQFNAVQVYTLKTKSSRSFQLDTRSTDYNMRGACKSCWDNVATYSNGALYWFSVGERVLIEFDLKSEKFRRSLKVLDDDDDVSRCVAPIQGTNLIVVRGGCLGLFVTYHDRGMNEDQEYFYLLTMKLAAAAADVDSNIISSWSMLKIQRPQGRICKPICSMASGELLMRIIKSNSTRSPYRRWLWDFPADARQHVGSFLPNLEKDLDISAKDGMMIYNPQDGTVKNLELHGAGEEDHCFQYIQYIQSLSVMPENSLKSSPTP